MPKARRKKTEPVQPKVSKHPGYECLYLGDKELKGYGFKTGDGLLDVAPFQTLKKSVIIEEIDFKGAMCAFHPFKAAITAYPNEDILFVWDPDEVKEAECNFYFCSSVETYDEEKAKLGIADDGKVMDAEEAQRQKEEDEKEEKLQKLAEEEEREKARINAAINELKKPLIARKWKDLGSFDEMNEAKIKNNRQRIRISICRKRKYFGQKVQFSDQENVNGMNIEIKSMQTRNGYDVYSKLTDKCNQSGESLKDNATQTQFGRKLNKIIQYEFNDGTANNKNKQKNQESDDEKIGFEIAKISNNEQQMNEDAEELNERLFAFLDDIFEPLSEMLTDNNLVNIFEDDFGCFEAQNIDKNHHEKTENIKEIQTFVDLNWSKSKKISNIEWMPSDKQIVAVSCVSNLPFDERVNALNQSKVSSILLWNLSHILLKAQTILTAPSDIFVFKFHPNRSNIVVGGLESGQVILWELDEKSAKNHNEETENNEIPRIEASMLSHIERSHSLRVSDILWLPQDLMMDKNGHLKYVNTLIRPNGAKRLSEEQFMSISAEGNILFWEIVKPQQTEKEKKKNESAKWTPFYCVKCEKTKLNESIFSDKETMQLFIDENMPQHIDENESNDNDNKNGKIFGSKMCFTPLIGKICIGSELGEFCLFNFGKIGKDILNERSSLLQNEQKSHLFFDELNETETESESESEKQRKLQKKANNHLTNLIIFSRSKLAKMHFSDVKSVALSPHFGDIYLTVSDWRFCIWHNNKLLFVSPYSSSYICCGCWSLTRPAVIFTAKIDGTLDVWDLIDQSHCALIANWPISSSAISSLTFSPFDNEQLAVGDHDGNLRILQIPRNLSIPLSNERKLMALFYQNEAVRIEFIHQRMSEHKQQSIEMEDEKEKNEQKEKEENEEKNDGQSMTEEDNEKRLEKKYESMLLTFKKKLKIDEK